MRFRGGTIRRKIVALLLVPLVSLTAMWGFATVITGREAAQLLDVAFVIEKVGYPVEDVVRVIQKERRQSLVLLGDPRASQELAELARRRTATDKVVAKIRRDALDPDVQEELSSDTSSRLNSILDAFEEIEALRRSVDRTELDPDQALELYNRLVDPCYTFLMNLHGLDNVEMDKQGRALVGITRARETLSREDAVIAAALAARRVTAQDTRTVSDLIANRRLLYAFNLEVLPGEERERFEKFWLSPETRPLRDAEEGFIAQGPTKRPRAVTAAEWKEATGQVLDKLGEMGTQAGDRYQQRVEPQAHLVLLKAAIAGFLGFLALLVSVLLSVRIGRDLVRDLSRLRKEAHEVSGVRLPSVMRRLAAGEQVDVETEAPRLEYDKDEIGQVGKALNTLQRAAVEAAVKQAELRRGVSEVFVNLARRNQVLLHRQLTLLDAMERRTEDSEELADLFRLDHMTTRMRRHAEGLVILSGAAPSRQWRKPVQLMDVVRAAVAEVEDYERIEVRRLPRLGIAGPAVADLTHLIAELIENATVFSPPHTAVQVLGERVANGFTLEIHDRGLGMAPEALLDANLRLAETPEFELSDTDRLGLFVVSRLAQRHSVRVSLQTSPYGGTTAVVFIPAPLLTEAPETNGTGFRLDKPDRDERRAVGPGRTGGAPGLPGAPRRPGLAGVPVQAGPSMVLDGPVELEAPISVLGLDDAEVLDGIPGIDDAPSRGGLLGGARPGTAAQERHAGGPVRLESARLDGVPGDGGRTEGPRLEAARADSARPVSGGPVPLPRRRRTPTLVADHGRRVDTRPVSVVPQPAPAEPAPVREGGPAGRTARPATRDAGPHGPTGPDRAALAGRPAGREPATGGEPPTGPGGLPRRIRQASLAPQLKDAPPAPAPTGPADDRDAEEVRSRMSALQRGWSAGRRHNAGQPPGPALNDPRNASSTSEGDGR
ncbi:nitrate- and nitrite sensing domain-containing protein [Streptomyces sp. NPDC086023]|uniref:nitrate- and nitrite sensing domain-containing protein n=1 Tax=Streptomyces sp. NPDC086023 TaxID=3365746 RepID=UPI0037D8199A